MSETRKEILVVGGGVIGLSAGWYLGEAGHAVRVVEREPSLAKGCSEGNAGMIVPSHFIPLAAPGVISQGLKWMLNPKSPFFLRPRLDPALARWIWLFARHANEGHVKKSEGLLRDLSLESRRLHLELAEREGYQVTERGLLMLCQSEAGLEEEAEVAARALELGLEAEVCDRKRVAELEPDAKTEALGAVWWPQDCHLSPADLIAGLRRGIVRFGGEFLQTTAARLVTDFKTGRVQGVVTEEGEKLSAQVVVVAGGMDSLDLLRPLGMKLPLQGGKGYSVTLPNPKSQPRLCSLLKEGRVAMTPMGETLRVAGTMEICGRDLRINPRRLAGVLEAFCRFYPEFAVSDFEGLEPWVGLRPCSPDGLPYLGAAKDHPGLIIAGGHAMMGLSLAPVTGAIVRDLVNETKSGHDLAQLDPNRFGGKN